MSGYLELAKKTIGGTSKGMSTKVLAEQECRKLEEAARRGLIIRRTREHGWISLHDPLTGEWHDFPTASCYPSIVEASKRRRQGAKYDA